MNLSCAERAKEREIDRAKEEGTDRQKRKRKKVRRFASIFEDNKQERARDEK